ncbi:hypothetical protein [Allorhodopirellula solitaria]|uniref:Uncharacterized protein n=1 Tax=Allorhodopirellula solitaria TaxID=2527987 RepID=A0A5C5XW51_9BACT|nr:hypothetical protein [Allorhodopirellula solitaria]TWT67557.1 hypothetical protein CA85_24080 [Allorhodopirellula solitaria]
MLRITPVVRMTVIAVAATVIVVMMPREVEMRAKCVAAGFPDAGSQMRMTPSERN